VNGNVDPPRGEWRVKRSGIELAVAEPAADGMPPLEAGPVALIAHGAGSSATFIEAAFARPLRAAGLRLVTFDLRGHGSSSLARSSDDHHIDEHAADLAAVASSIPGEVMVVGGVSLGAHAAVRAVTQRRLACKAVLACLPAWTGKAAPGEGPHAATAAEVQHVGVTRVISRLRDESGIPSWLRETLVAAYSRHDPASLIAALAALDGGEAPSRSELGSLPVPLAVVGWVGDPAHPLEVAREWAAAAPNGQLITVEFGEMEGGVDRLGEGAVEALAAIGLPPSE
jgi:pimeloyl-ACP methyl ester carboxylesterase